MVHVSIGLPDERRSEIPPCWLEKSGIDANSDGKHPGWQIYWENLGDTQRLFQEQSEEYVRKLEVALRPDPHARVLDFGCGFGHVAEILTPKVGEIFLWDASANMRQHARLKLASRRNVRFLDLSDPKTLPQDPRFDLVLVNSVVQYMPFDEFSAWLMRWRTMLATDGRIVISDLIPPDYVAIWDIVDLLRLSKRRGFLLRASREAVGEIWGYWSVRRSRPLCRIDREELIEHGRAIGLTVSFLSTNLTHFTRRFTAVLTHVEEYP